MDSDVERFLSQARSIEAKFNQGSETRCIDEAIVLVRKALDLCTPDHPKRYTCLNQLAAHTYARYNQLGETDNLDEAIVLDREALTLHPIHRDGSWSLNNLAVHLSTRYEQLGALEDLNEAIDLGRRALMLHPPGDPYRSTSLNNLAVDLYTRYEQCGEVVDLTEAIDLNRNALALRPPGHPLRSSSLGNLANYLWTRYKLLGGVEDLSTAIVLSRGVLALCPPGHSDRSMSLSNLAVHLYARYGQLGGVEDLTEAIDLDRDALALRPPGHPDRSSSLNNLSICLCARYKQLGAVEDLTEAIDLDRDALALRPPGHPSRSTSLSNLAIRLYARYSELGGAEDLTEAIDLDRDALELRQSGHPARTMSLNNLAIHLYARHEQLGKEEDLTAAIGLNRDALALRPPGYPNRSTSLNNLAICLYARYKQLGDPEDQDEIFRLYNELAHDAQTVSLDDVNAAKAWVDAAEVFHHPTTLLAYEIALRLLVQHLAVLPSLPQHLAVLQSLTSSLAVDAFSACLRTQSPTKAVELLEQGRGVFWAQLTRLRSPLDDVMASGPEGKTLADHFTCLTSLIRTVLNSTSIDQHDWAWRLNLELQRVVSDIRELPGLSRFLLPSLFSDLQRAASGGPVIIVNASKYSCDALVVFADKNPVHIPLSITKARVQAFASELRTLTLRVKKSDATRDLGIILRKLWDRIVCPIVDFLQTVHPIRSRIWWCPTAEFSLLPLHAAGPYRKGQQNLSGLYISSYTPTLTALIRARRISPTPAGQRKNFIAIGQANAIGTRQLASVSTELATIGECIEGLATFTRIEGQDACMSRVADELGKHAWVHLACHGLPDQKQPFESAFALHDGHFTIQRILQCDVHDPEFAYLSACHTTVGDDHNPDEVIHLASAMQFAGFQSVIGTLWAVDDAETNKITSVFYKQMVDASGCLDHTRAAYALWKTMTLTSVDVPLDQRILYIHLGA